MNNSFPQLDAKISSINLQNVTRLIRNINYTNSSKVRIEIDQTIDLATSSTITNDF